MSRVKSFKLVLLGRLRQTLLSRIRKANGAIMSSKTGADPASGTGESAVGKSSLVLRFVCPSISDLQLRCTNEAISLLLGTKRIFRLPVLIPFDVFGIQLTGDVLIRESTIGTPEFYWTCVPSLTEHTASPRRRFALPFRR